MNRTERLATTSLKLFGGEGPFEIQYPSLAECEEMADAFEALGCTVIRVLERFHLFVIPPPNQPEMNL